MTTTPPLDFWRSLAAEVVRSNTPSSPDARRLLRLIDLHRSLMQQTDEAHGLLAEGLAANLLPAIEAAAARLRL